MVGERIELDIDRVAHGGFCVGRFEGRAVFVRHTLPGERVVAVVTEGQDGDRYLRADAVEVLRAAADRVVPPCGHAHPGGCGGCDWQHVTLPAQRRLKAAVIAEQLSRLAQCEIAVEVEPVGAEADESPSAGFGWRTRVGFATDAEGRLGLRRHRSHELELLDTCPIAAPTINTAIRGQTFPGVDSVTVSVTAEASAVGDGGAGASFTLRRGREVVEQVGPQVVSHVVRHRRFAAEADGFWQVHPAAAEVLVGAVLEVVAPRPGDTALDLYAGVGLFAAFLAEAVGPSGRVMAIEGARGAITHAETNLADLAQASVERGSVELWLTGRRSMRQRPGPSPVTHADVIVLDPPRKGATKAVIQPITALQPRAIAYVACDPAALARDTALLAERGYRLDSLRAFDLFPMTHHVECVAGFVPA